ncbi:MAG: NAD(P)-dependent oxidoreductase [Chitinophagaceae bacterium]|nr:NAD(P)-dependent oxidoreductase [Anaerolineae bacterium]
MLLTGATGKVGSAFLNQLLTDSRFDSFVVRALVHHRQLEARERLEMMQGSIEHQETVQKAMAGVTHVIHLATCKETPSQIMDVAVKGLFWLLEAAHTSDTFEQFILIGGDAGMGHFHYPHPVPVTEQQKHSAYAGCYALSKVLEEVMLEQYYLQYNLNGCCLRAPWIMEKDDFKFHLSFGEDVFGGPRWRDIVGASQAEAYRISNMIPLMLDAKGEPMRRNFVHVDDLVSAIFAAIDHPNAHQQTFNICMDEPVDYRKSAEYLYQTRGYPSIEIKSEFYSTWLDNTKAKFLLGWRPHYGLAELVDAAFQYERDENDPRVIWYPG